MRSNITLLPSVVASSVVSAVASTTLSSIEELREGVEVSDPGVSPKNIFQQKAAIMSRITSISIPIIIGTLILSTVETLS